LTNEIEESARLLIADVERMGGMVAAIESGWVQQQIADAAWDYQRQVEEGGRVIVGVNEYVEDEPVRVEIHRHLEDVAARQSAALATFRAKRDASAVAATLGRLRAAASGDVNLMPALIESVKAYTTIGEMCGVLREVFGEYRVTQIY